MLANIKALDLCMCGCMYTHTITHTHTHPCIQTIVSITPISSYPELCAVCFYDNSLSLSHTHAQTALSLACIDFKTIFSFITYSRQNFMTIGFEAFVFSQSTGAVFFCDLPHSLSMAGHF